MIYNRNNFTIASLCPGEERYYLNGIHVTPEHTEVTNGHYLVRVSAPHSKEEIEKVLKDLPEVTNHEPKKEEERFTFPAQSAIEVEKSIPKNKGYGADLERAWITKNTTEEEAEFVSYDLTTVRPIKARKIDGKWPRTEMIMPKDKPEMTLGFNPEYMLKICRVFKKMQLRSITLDLYGDKKAMRMTGKTTEGQEITVLLMPVVI